MGCRQTQHTQHEASIWGQDLDQNQDLGLDLHQELDWDLFWLWIRNLNMGSVTVEQTCSYRPAGHRLPVHVCRGRSQRRPITSFVVSNDGSDFAINLLIG